MIDGAVKVQFRVVSRPSLAALLALSLVVPASGCGDMQNNQKTFLGALGGGVVGSGACLLARGNGLACALAGIGGAVIGGAVGHAFDERDRARRDAAVRHALDQQAMWQPPIADVPRVASDVAVGVTSRAPAPGLGEDDANPSPQDKMVVHRVVTAKPAVTWHNPDTNDSGVIVPLRTFASPATGKTCKIFREDYIKDGKQYSDTMQACPKPDSTYDIKSAT